MVTQTTHNVKITVKTIYQEDYSSPAHGHYLFSYQITIENYSEYTIRLVSRHWHIFDSSNEHREVEGEGVVGQQPVLEPGENYSYESACNLTSDFGKMHGTYLMERKIDGHKFYVKIPEFQLIVPGKLN
jgi:ApaG protein